jgi:hypothetical protein
MDTAEARKFASSGRTAGRVANALIFARAVIGKRESDDG